MQGIFADFVRNFWSMALLLHNLPSQAMLPLALPLLLLVPLSLPTQKDTDRMQVAVSQSA